MSVRIGYKASAEQCRPRDRDLDAAYRPCRWWAALALSPEHETGVKDLVLHGRGGDQRRFIGQFTTDVLPSLRERAERSVLTTTGSSA